VLRAFLSAVLTAVLAGSMLAGIAGASVDKGAAPGSDTARGHVKPLPKFVEKWQRDKAAAADAVATGEATPNADGVVELKNGKFVEHRLEKTDHIVTVLVEFSDVAHNQMAAPDRSVDNSTYWTRDFSRAHYQDMLFAAGGGSYGMPSMRDFYLELSSGRYTVGGQISNWVRVSNPAAEYGENSSEGPGSDNANGPVYRVVRDALLATSGANHGVNWDPAVVDVWDRYDCDGDGNFDERDGYVDHFQVVHAGAGEEAGGGAQGGDAIWSHRWYANFAGSSEGQGPTGCKLGGYEVPGTDLWVGDYTIEPENGAVGVFAHEFGHDLGLPDLYDTAGGENGTGFWTLMSSGSWASDDPNAIDTKPVHMGSWEKLVLGWLDLATTSSATGGEFELGPAEGSTNRNRAQALRINLPDYSKTVTVFAPEGTDPNYYYSGQGHDLNNSMTRALGTALGADTPLSFRANYDIEVDWDYAYVEASSDGTTFKSLQTNLSTTTNPNGQNQGFGITGVSAGWVTGTATVPAGTTHLRFRYWTDGAVSEPGIAVDSIQLGTFSDNGTTPSNWTFDGFSQVANGQITQTFFHYYLVESRSYVKNDRSLCGAYNFLYGNWLEKQCYADGLLVWYRNSAYTDNETSQHPGFGQVLPVDSHPAPMVMPDGKTYWRTRWQSWDSTFGVDPSSVRLHQTRGGSTKLIGRTYDAAAVKVFHDSSPTAYWDARIPRASVRTAGSGVRVEIIGVSSDRTSYRVRVR
jgi:immune inhibitor A